jgi:hypothetical protein
MYQGIGLGVAISRLNVGPFKGVFESVMLQPPHTTQLMLNFMNQGGMEIAMFRVWNKTLSGPALGANVHPNQLQYQFPKHTLFIFP